MQSSSAVYRIGTRSSNLALVQARQTVAELSTRLPGLEFTLVRFDSPGDRDRKTDLRESPSDFFTRDLDDAVRNGTLDAAVHSAKDVPDPVPEGLDWVWLPWRAEPRDALVARPGEAIGDLPPALRIGVSSERRAAYCTDRFPEAVQCAIRGNIEDRLRQLDQGDVDLLVMAAAALQRLGLGERITELIPLTQLPVPEGQGRLCLTFRHGDPVFLRLRALFVKAVRFVGAGVGAAENATLVAQAALRDCDICFHDSLMDQGLLVELPPHARAVYVGKRAGAHSRAQGDINALLADAVRKGLRVVRLKGGDPAIFGRLAEELATLEELRIAYRIVPGISTLNALSSKSGILLTRRGGANGFAVFTPRQAGGGVSEFAAERRGRYPVVAYMAVKTCGEVCEQLRLDGWDAATPAAMVYGVGSDQEFAVRGTIGDLAARVGDVETDLPGILVAGSEAAREARQDGSLRGMRVLLTCSEALQAKASREVVDRGGVPVPFPVLQLVPTGALAQCASEIEAFDWLVVTSPSSARVLLTAGIDPRRLPRIATCGSGTNAEFERHGIVPDLSPAAEFGAEALVDLLDRTIPTGARLLRLRSDKAGACLAEQLRGNGYVVEDCIAYATKPVAHECLPAFDAVCFASSSAVEFFTASWGADVLADKPVVCIGRPTAAALRRLGRTPDGVGAEATMAGCIGALAAHVVEQELLDLQQETAE